jgi:hypothetical protein
MILAQLSLSHKTFVDQFFFGADFNCGFDHHVGIFPDNFTPKYCE